MNTDTAAGDRLIATARGQAANHRLPVPGFLPRQILVFGLTLFVEKVFLVLVEPLACNL